MSLNNKIIDCLGKSLKSEIKSISICKVKYFDSKGNELKVADSNKKKILCISKDRTYILNEDLKHLQEYFFHNDIDGVEIDNKNIEIFVIWLIRRAFSSQKIHRVVILTKFRATLIKNYICYYSLYYAHFHHKFRELRLAYSIESNEKILVQPTLRGLSRIYSQISYKGYE